MHTATGTRATISFKSSRAAAVNGELTKRVRVIDPRSPQPYGGAELRYPASEDEYTRSGPQFEASQSVRKALRKLGKRTNV